MKAIKIDVVKKEIYEVTIEDSLQSIYQQIEADMIETAVHLPKNDVVYVDEEGLLRETSKGWFIIYGQPQPLSGHGLVLGVTRNGSSRDVQATVEYIRKIVVFP